jgi:hypothetical protein
MQAQSHRRRPIGRRRSLRVELPGEDFGIWQICDFTAVDPQRHAVAHSSPALSEPPGRGVDAVNLQIDGERRASLHRLFDTGPLSETIRSA